MATKATVLFLCTGNSARSQMAEGLLRARAGDAYEARSAGTEPARAVNPLAILVMGEIGVDISSHRPKNVEEYLGRIGPHHLIIVCDGANRSCPTVFPGAITRDFWPIDDPAAFRGTERERRDAFRAARDEISERLDAWLAKKVAP